MCQEDCKYEYVYNNIKNEKNKRIVGVGRINFLLTIVNAIGCIQKFEQIILKSKNKLIKLH